MSSEPYGAKSVEAAVVRPPVAAGSCRGTQRTATNSTLTNR
jgi:hypothetical protein